MSRRRLSLAGVTLLALGSSACIDVQTLGTMRGVITPLRLLQDERIKALAATTAEYSLTWIAAATVLALFWLHFKLRQGERGAVLPVILYTTLAYTIAVPTKRDALYWPRAAVQVGDDLANLYPVTDWIGYGGTTGGLPDVGIRGVTKLTWAAIRQLRYRVTMLGGDRRDPQYLESEAVTQWVSSPGGALLVALATTGSYISALALQIIQSTLLALLGVLLPLVTPFVLFPGTRHIFWGYVRWFAALLLWGALFRIVEQVMLSVHLSVLTEPLRAAVEADSTWALAQVIPNSLAAGLVVHLAFFGLQFMVPALAYSVVNGVAQRTLR